MKNIWLQTYRVKRMIVEFPRSINKPFPELTASKIVESQPLLRPTGLVYYLRFRYGKKES